MEKIYGETGTAESFERRILELSNRIAMEMAPDIVADQLSMSVESSSLDGMDGLNLEVRLRQTLAASIAYTTLERCGIDADDYAGIEFPYLHEFNTMESLLTEDEYKAASRKSG